jgi:hypothetical protein
LTEDGVNHNADKKANDEPLVFEPGETCYVVSGHVPLNVDGKPKNEFTTDDLFHARMGVMKQPYRLLAKTDGEMEKNIIYVAPSENKLVCSFLVPEHVQVPLRNRQGMQMGQTTKQNWVCHHCDITAEDLPALSQLIKENADASTYQYLLPDILAILCIKKEISYSPFLAIFKKKEDANRYAAEHHIAYLKGPIGGLFDPDESGPHLAVVHECVVKQKMELRCMNKALNSVMTPVCYGLKGKIELTASPLGSYPCQSDGNALDVVERKSGCYLM